MLLGLLADIHEAVEPLREALDLFARHGVEEVIVLGDICRMHRRLAETVALLREARAVGVWGNHDFGLCRDIGEDVRRHFAPSILEYTQTLQPTLVRKDCLFTHVEPWLDANDLASLWYFDPPPQTPEGFARIFEAVPQRVLFSGHVHRWSLATPAGAVEWDGTTPIRLAPPGRYFVVVGAVVEGHAATFDTATGDLVPLRLTALDEEE
jgi:predicted phosphodiesterase